MDVNTIKWSIDMLPLQLPGACSWEHVHFCGQHCVVCVGREGEKGKGERGGGEMEGREGERERKREKREFSSKHPSLTHLLHNMRTHKGL